MEPKQIDLSLKKNPMNDEWFMDVRVIYTDNIFVKHQLDFESFHHAVSSIPSLLFENPKC